MFLTSGMMARYHAQYFEHHKKHAVEFDPDTTKFSDRLMLKVGQFNKLPRLFQTEPISNKDVQPDSKHVVVSPNGKWLYANQIFPSGRELCLFQGKRRGYVYFTGNAIIPTLFSCDASGRPRKVWMSMTPGEILSQRAGIIRARGKVLIGGLGLGWFLRKVLAKKSVTEVVLVEQCRDLLAWYGRSLCKQLATEHGKSVKVICDDVWNHIGKHGDETRYLLDIWDSYGTELEGEQLAVASLCRHFWGWGIGHAVYD